MIRYKITYWGFLQIPCLEKGLFSSSMHGFTSSNKLQCSILVLWDGLVQWICMKTVAKVFWCREQGYPARNDG